MESQYIYKVKNHDCKIQLYQAHSIVNSFVKNYVCTMFSKFGFFHIRKNKHLF